MMDISVLYNKYKFIGNEFLTWLLFSINNDKDYLEKIKKSKKSSLEIGNHIVMQNIKKNINKTIIIKGNEVNLEEGMTALRMGAVVSELSLIYTNEDKIWKFYLKGDSLNLNSLKHPKIYNFRKLNNIESIFLEKVYLYDEIIFLISELFIYFIKFRVSEKWNSEIVISIKKWILGKY